MATLLTGAQSLAERTIHPLSLALIWRKGLTQMADGGRQLVDRQQVQELRSLSFPNLFYL